MLPCHSLLPLTLRSIHVGDLEQWPSDPSRHLEFKENQFQILRPWKQSVLKLTCLRICSWPRWSACSPFIPPLSELPVFKRKAHFTPALIIKVPSRAMMKTLVWLQGNGMTLMEKGPFAIKFPILYCPEN